MIRIITEFGLNIGVFISTLFLTFLATKISRSRKIARREKYLLDSYKENGEIEFTCKDFDFFDHDECYNKELIKIDISTTGIICYDFNKSAGENIKHGHFKKIAAFIKEFYSLQISNPALFIEESAKEIDISKQYDFVQYGVKEISRSRKDIHGKLEAAALYMKLQKIDPHSALLIDTIYRRLRLIKETPLRLKSRELKFDVGQLESINDLNRLLIFLSTIRQSGLIAQKKRKESTPDLIFKTDKDRNLFYAYDFPLTDQNTLDYEVDILDHVRKDLNLIRNNERAISINITDICFNYTNGFHLKFLSYLGYIDNEEIKGKTLKSLPIQYTELKSHLTYKCADVELTLYALSLSKKTSNNIPCFLNNLN